MAVAAAAWAALSWDIPPQNGHDVYFSRDLYEKYSLAPTLSELMSLSKRPSENKAAASQSGPKKKQQPGQEAAVTAEPSVALPQEPRVPYPYVSSLSEKEQRRYLFLLSEYLNADPNLLPWSQQRNYTQYLQMREFVSKEVAEFLKFARNAARSCAKDYSDISEDALLYTKDFLSARMDCVKNYPERYSLHEVTSLMGGRFTRELTLKFEKSLVALGMVHLVKRFFPKLPTSINLPADKTKHEQLCGTPEHRAAQLHNDISTDPNAEKLAAKYCPQVVLTGESLYTLLNNHGLDYKQQWELPVLVKTVSLAGLKPVKVAYINPPLPKKEMSVREKNQLFHEFLIDFYMTKQSSIVSRAVILDKPSEEMLGTELKTCQGRPLQESVSADLDFDTDVTELESFASAARPLTASPAEVSPAKVAFSEYLTMEKGQEGRRSKVKDQETDFSSRKASALGKNPPDLDNEGNSSGDAFEPMETDPDGRNLALAKEKNLDHNILIASSDKNCNITEGTAKDVRSPALSCSSDMDGEHLIIIIDPECEPGHAPEPGAGGSAPPSPRPGQALSERPAESLETHEKSVPCKLRPRLSEKIDPLGQILKMQTKLLKPSSPNSHGHLPVTSERSLNPTQGQADAPSLPLASSVVEPGQNTVANIGTSSKFTWATCYQGPQKGMLWDAVEETADYEPPQHGNLVYKLYSLDDMLLLVRTTVQKAELRPHQKKAKFRRHFPVYMLPKLEYQAFYGVEALTEDEVCLLWTESLLHSNTSFTVGHIDALTSQLFLLERLTGKALKRRFGTFNPTNSLHILQNILKKVAGLQEGSFLLTHLAGDSSVSIYKSSEGIATRAMYNLHAAHANLPPTPASLSVPWVPLDPNIPLPHHFAQGRVPCTFPPVPDKGARTMKMSRKAKAFPGTPSHRGPISTESRDRSLQAEPPRKKRGTAQNKGSRPANQGPNRKFWKKKHPNQGHMT
ncbi:little elongation complex subunit 2 isoform X2 [Ahaetulla prasina]|uniref:little elongation complex subunit 2 isoform X2 n=1 Tax=Ahaetulla prasina TaxID=499056 RepID=UPI002647045B|nr:little elongation complex subunit 2 isoform X2 [Ahaetulla prasina]